MPKSDNKTYIKISAFGAKGSRDRVNKRMYYQYNQTVFREIY